MPEEVISFKLCQ
jgi:hypothetical protein